MTFFHRFSYFTFLTFILITMLVPSLRFFPHSTITSFLYADLYVPVTLRFFSQFRIPTIYLVSNFVLTFPSTLFHIYFILIIYITNIFHRRYVFFNFFFKNKFPFPPFSCILCSLPTYSSVSFRSHI